MTQVPETAQGNSAPYELNGGQPNNLHTDTDPARLSFLDIATAYDTANGHTYNIDVMGVADPRDPWIRVGTLRFTPDDARRLAHALIVAAAAADNELGD